MSFSFLGALGSLFPGYIQGQRMANQDNWQDLVNWNNVQAGQQFNLFTEATWQPRLDIAWSNRNDKVMQEQMNRWNTGLYYLSLPQMMNNAYAGNYYSQFMAGMPYMAQMAQFQNIMQNQGNLGQMIRGQTPSAVIR